MMSLYSKLNTVLEFLSNIWNAQELARQNKYWSAQLLNNNYTGYNLNQNYGTFDSIHNNIKACLENSLPLGIGAIIVTCSPNDGRLNQFRILIGSNDIKQLAESIDDVSEIESYLLEQKRTEFEKEKQEKKLK